MRIDHMKKEKKKSKKIWMISGLVTVVVIITALVVSSQVRAARADSDKNQSVETITLKKTDITKTVSVSGVVESAQVTNIYTTQSYPVKRIYVSVGDKVRVGDVLVELDMSRLETDISQTEINLKSAEASAEEELRSNRNNVVNAQTSLDSSRITLSRQQLNIKNAESDLRDAEEKMSEGFDGYTCDNMITDTRLSLERKTEDLEKAQDDLNDAINNFDDYSFKNAIADAKNNLDRRKDELSEAEKSSNREQTSINVNTGGYQSAVKAAQTMLTIKENALKSAQGILDNATAAGDEEAIAAATVLRDTAEQERNTAQTALASANKDLDYALRTGNSSDSSDTRVTNALYALKDAQNAYDRTVTNLERAKSDAVDAATEGLKRAQNAFNDAQRAYEKALEDKIRAIDNNTDNVESKLENAKKVYEDSQRQLEASENGVKSAQNSLDQAQHRPTSQGSNVEIQELNLERLNNQLKEGIITATADGVVTEINAKAGALPTGIIIVIEDTENLHVSARVKEYSISSINTGQDAVITTDATGNKEYGGKVSYISPRAVSAAGSTSVEFEVQAELFITDAEIRIGMNAFLNIITDKKSDVFAVPLSAVVTNERGSFIYTPSENGEVTEIAVHIGLRTSTMAEISGENIKPGMEIILRPNDTGQSAPLRSFGMMGGGF